MKRRIFLQSSTAASLGLLLPIVGCHWTVLLVIKYMGVAWMPYIRLCIWQTKQVKKNI